MLCFSAFENKPLEHRKMCDFIVYDQKCGILPSFNTDTHIYVLAAGQLEFTQ